jgi:hypothetical protein
MPHVVSRCRRTLDVNGFLQAGRVARDWLFQVKRLAEESDMRVGTAFKRTLGLRRCLSVVDVSFEVEGVIVTLRLPGHRRLVCSEYGQRSRHLKIMDYRTKRWRGIWVNCRVSDCELRRLRRGLLVRYRLFTTRGKNPQPVVEPISQGSTELPHEACAKQSRSGAARNILVDALIEIVINTYAVATSPRDVPLTEAAENIPGELLRLGRRRFVPDLHHQEQCATISRDTSELGDRGIHVIDMIQCVQARHDVEPPGLKRHPLGRRVNVGHGVVIDAKLSVCIGQRIQAHPLRGHSSPLQTPARPATDIQDTASSVEITSQVKVNGKYPLVMRVAERALYLCTSTPILQLGFLLGRRKRTIVGTARQVTQSTESHHQKVAAWTRHRTVMEHEFGGRGRSSGMLKSGHARLTRPRAWRRGIHRVARAESP